MRSGGLPQLSPSSSDDAVRRSVPCAGQPLPCRIRDGCAGTTGKLRVTWVTQQHNIGYIPSLLLLFSFSSPCFFSISSLSFVSPQLSIRLSFIIALNHSSRARPSSHSSFPSFKLQTSLPPHGDSSTTSGRRVQGNSDASAHLLASDSCKQPLRPERQGLHRHRRRTRTRTGPRRSASRSWWEWYVSASHPHIELHSHTS